MNEFLLTEAWTQLATGVANIVVQPKVSCLIFISASGAGPAAGSQLGITLTERDPFAASDFLTRTIWARKVPGSADTKVVVASW